MKEDKFKVTELFKAKAAKAGYLISIIGLILLLASEKQFYHITFE